VAFEQVHVFNAAEVAIERCRENDDGNVRAAAAKESGYFSAELAGSEVVVEDRYVDLVEEVRCLFDGGSGEALIAVLAQNGGAEMEICGLVVEQENTHGLRVSVRHSMENAGDAVGRFNHVQGLF
jgi:hypothetical protein